jgi:hypothetical protein
MNYQVIKTYLEQQPLARERKNKNRCLANLIIKEYNIEIDKGKLTDIVGEILNMDRAWRKVLEENENLRGQDYKEKVILEQKKMLELGYEPKL